jgi:hypothetical protein
MPTSGLNIIKRHAGKRPITSFCSSHCSSLKMMIVDSVETMISVYNATRLHISENSKPSNEPEVSETERVRIQISKKKQPPHSYLSNYSTLLKCVTVTLKES